MKNGKKEKCSLRNDGRRIQRKRVNSNKQPLSNKKKEENYFTFC